MTDASAPTRANYAQQTAPEPISQDTEQMALTKVVELYQRTVTRQSQLMAFVALVAIIGLAAAVYTYTAESQIARNLHEDEQWREALKLVGSGNPAVSTALLKSFVSSPRYGKQAIETGHLILSKLISYDQFEPLFNSIYAPPSSDNIADIIDLNRKLYRRAIPIWGAQADFNKLSNKQRSIKGEQISDTDAQASEINNEIILTANSIASVLRSSGWHGSAKPNLSDTFLYKADLSGIDFSNISLRDAELMDLDVAGAKLVDVETSENTDWYNVRWWKAGQVSVPLLMTLKEHFYPYYRGDIYSGTKPTREEYQLDLTRLCRDASLDCSSPKYGPKPSD
jgi:hypothetical protein